MKKLILLLVVFLFIATLSACSSGYTNISNEELTTMLESPDDYQFIDVRTIDEYYAGHVPGFNRTIDFYVFENDYSLLDGLDKDLPVVIMCNSGNRSATAADIFTDLGFKEVYNLEFGIEQWDGDIQ